MVTSVSIDIESVSHSMPLPVSIDIESVSHSMLLPVSIDIEFVSHSMSLPVSIDIESRLSTNLASLSSNFSVFVCTLLSACFNFLLSDFASLIHSGCSASSEILSLPG